MMLQSANMDLPEAYGMVGSTIETILEVCNEYKAQVYDIAVNLANNVNVEVSVPQTVGQQIHRANVPTSEPVEHYRINVSSVR